MQDLFGGPAVAGTGGLEREGLTPAPPRPMKLVAEFFVPGKAVAKQRARTVTRDRNGNPLPFARTYTPKPTETYEGVVRTIADEAMGGAPPALCPLRLELVFLLATPSSWSQKRKREALAGVFAPTKKPDLDNLEKSIKDACNKVVWKDDSQVVSVVKDKVYSERIGVQVRVYDTGARAAP